jgi:hypothetical protein
MTVRSNCLLGAWHTAHLAAFWAVEEYPDHEIGRELFETVLLPGWHKDERPDSNCVPLATIEELTVSTDDNVDLIPRMRPLTVNATRRVQLGFE